MRGVANVVGLRVVLSGKFTAMCIVAPAIPDGQNQRNMSGAVSDPGQQVRFWGEGIQNLERSIRDSEVSELSRCRTAGCGCTLMQRKRGGRTSLQFAIHLEGLGNLSWQSSPPCDTILETLERLYLSQHLTRRMHLSKIRILSRGGMCEAFDIGTYYQGPT
ncbi:hypothetical protein HOY80DRAFT_707700 [Tuber brumale]|nr:hypothetical protein HOY80DRAFT_707700 [Tuber brumale]